MSEPLPNRRIAVVGLGYVGLPVAVSMARVFPGTVGFDIDAEHVRRLAAGFDRSGEVPADELLKCGVELSTDPEALRSADFYIVAVPTPVDAAKRPDLGPLQAASRTVGAVLSPGDIVVFESTVYPGVTEQVCGPILEQASGLRAGIDFKLAYSPERINPGDPEHRFETITKVVSGQDEVSLDIVAEVYGRVVRAGVYRASSIQVAEASKVIENIQRDLNIALMNELAVIFDRLGLDTSDVLAASGSKWNFLPFHPGLVGGHCIGVDPYYLTARAEEVGVTPQVILAGRRINDGMGEFIAQRAIKALALARRQIRDARVGVLGLAFKDGVGDIRNSRVPDIVAELESYGVTVLVHDPLVDPVLARQEYGITLAKSTELGTLDAFILAVPHQPLIDLAYELLSATTPVVIDVRSVLDRAMVPDGIVFWRL